MQDNCCTPRSVRTRAATNTGEGPPGPANPSQQHTQHDSENHGIEQVHVPARTFLMGDGHGDGRRGDGERPVHPVFLDAFQIDATSVTNENFARFVAATGYLTEAEVFGFSAVFHLGVRAPEEAVIGPAEDTNWWWGVRGADWAHPGGPDSDVADSADHPVVHVSWNDAQAYCHWAARRLPTEAQWECASRGGMNGARFPWGNDLLSANGSWQANIWQGTFPTQNTAEDGWITTAPARSYLPNGWGLWQTVGNVWEWCEDIFKTRTYAARASAQPVPNPRVLGTDGPQVLRGGSYLCHDSYCNRYRNSARSSNTADSSMGNAGFRTVSL